MTVRQLIEKLNEFPMDMPVATMDIINPEDRDNPDFIDVGISTWEHDSYPYDKPSFEYVNLR